MDDNKSRRFEMRLTEATLISLNRLAHKRGMDRTAVITTMIHQAAKRSNCYPYEGVDRNEARG